MPQQNQDNSSPLNELIAQLSLALVRSFAQILSSQQKDSTNNNESNSGGGGIIRTTREGIGGFFGIPFGQPIQQQQQQPFQSPSFTGKISNNYGNNYILKKLKTFRPFKRAVILNFYYLKIFPPKFRLWCKCWCFCWNLWW